MVYFNIKIYFQVKTDKIGHYYAIFFFFFELKYVLLLYKVNNDD